MNKLPRSAYGSGFFHVMVQGLNKEYIFNTSKDKEEYLTLMMKNKDKYNILLLAYCIMGNHSHILLYTDEVLKMSMFMKNINSKFAISYNKRNKRVGYVFRDRFNSQYINNPNYLLRCLNYIHMNPLKAKIVDRVEDYKYSTYNDYVNKSNIVNDVVIEKIFGKTENYKDIFINISDKDFEVMDVDREEKNFEIATTIFLEMRNITLDEIKRDEQYLKEFCTEIVQNKGYKQSQVAKLLDIRVCKISRIISNARNCSERNVANKGG